MSTSITDNFLHRLDEHKAVPLETPAVEMTFAGLPCKVRPLSLDIYLRSGRLPDYLTRIALSDFDAGTVAQETAGITTEAVLEGRKFQRVAVCRVLVEPRVADVPESETPEGCLSYRELSERAPDFVDTVFAWVLRGCPAPVKGGEGVDGEALENFPEKPERAKSTRPRRRGKADGRKTVAAAEG